MERPPLSTMLKWENKRTRAPKHFDEASLIEAMTNVGKYVDDKEQKKILNQTLGIRHRGIQSNYY